MLELSITFLVVGVLAEVAGLLLIVGESRAAAATLRAWQTWNPEGHTASHEQLVHIGDVIQGLLGDPKRRRLAASLIGLGIVANTCAAAFSLALP